LDRKLRHAPPHLKTDVVSGRWSVVREGVRPPVPASFLTTDH
jgi:hypothetical protein